MCIGQLSSYSWPVYGSGLRKGQGWSIEAQSLAGQQGGGSPLDCVTQLSLQG